MSGLCVCLEVCECLCVGFPYLWFVLCLIKRFYYILFLSFTYTYFSFYPIVRLLLSSKSYKHINVYIKKNDTSLPFDLPSQTFYLFITVCSLSFLFFFLFISCITFLHFIFCVKI